MNFVSNIEFQAGMAIDRQQGIVAIRTPHEPLSLDLLHTIQETVGNHAERHIIFGSVDPVAEGQRPHVEGRFHYKDASDILTVAGITKQILLRQSFVLHSEGGKNIQTVLDDMNVLFPAEIPRWS